MREVTFRSLAPNDEAAIIAAQQTMGSEGFTFAFGYELGDDFEACVSLLDRRRQGKDLVPGGVPATFEVVVVDGTIAGRLSVRHALNDFLRKQGGHIGYGVLPGFRRQGLGTALMNRGLQVVQKLGISPVLVTCDEDNWASRRIIERAGGTYESSFADGNSEVQIRRYWLAS